MQIAGYEIDVVLDKDGYLRMRNEPKRGISRKGRPRKSIAKDNPAGVEDSKTLKDLVNVLYLLKYYKINPLNTSFKVLCELVTRHLRLVKGKKVLNSGLISENYSHKCLDFVKTIYFVYYQL